MPRHDGVGSKGAPPAPRLVVRSSCFDHPKSDIGKYVHSHPFNNAMELLLPVLPGSDSKQVRMPALSSLAFNVDPSRTLFPFRSCGCSGGLVNRSATW